MGLGLGLGVGVGRLHSREKVGFSGRDVAAAAATAAAAAAEAARFDRELAVSRRSEASPLAAADAPARFRRELAVSSRAEAAAAAGVEVAGTAAAAGAAAGAALFQGLLCALVGVRAGAGEHAVGRRTGWRVDRGDEVAAPLAEVETEAVGTDAVHFHPVL